MHRTIAAAEVDYLPNAVRPTNPLNLDYLIVIDFQATCQEGCPNNWVHEIIEFPALLLNVETLIVVSLNIIFYTVATHKQN